MQTSFRVTYVSLDWKVAEIIMIAKPGKPQNEVPFTKL